jgi:hypothetical protein
MSIGNLKDYGNKGNNFPWQLKMLQGLQAIYDATNAPLTCVDNSVTICGPAGGLDVNLHDGAGTAITSTPDGLGNTGIDVNIIGGVTLEVNLDPDNDSVGIYGYTNPADPSTFTGIKVDASGVLAIQDNGGSITVDGTVALDSATLTALENITVQNGAGAAAVNIQDGGNSITVDATSLPLPTGAATEVTLAAVNTKLTAATRTPGIRTYVNVTGAVASGLYSFSIANVGSAAGSVDGETLPAGVTINFDAGALNNTLGGLSFDATGTTFVVTTIS